MNLKIYLEKIVDWLVTSGPKILLILLLMLIAIKIIKTLCPRLFGKYQEGKDDEFKKRSLTLASVIASALTIVVVAVASVMILQVLTIPIAPVLAGAGVAGVALGFGAQNLVRDVVNGFFILLDDQIRTGDVVEIAGKGGLVEKVTLRMTILRDLSGNVHYVRNGEINVVTNMTKEYSRYVFDIGVAYREDVDEVIEIVKQIDQELRNDPEFANDILEPIEVLGLDQFASSSIIIKARTKTKPIRQWAVAREFNRRLKKRFDEKNIEIPFPHVTLYMGQDKKGQSPPLNVMVEKS